MGEDGGFPFPFHLEVLRAHSPDRRPVRRRTVGSAARRLRVLGRPSRADAQRTGDRRGRPVRIGRAVGLDLRRRHRRRATPAASRDREFTAPLEITSAERTVVVEGDGDPIESGDLVAVRRLDLRRRDRRDSSQSGGYDTDDPARVPVTVGVGRRPVLRLRDARARASSMALPGDRAGAPRRSASSTCSARRPPPRGASRRSRSPACRRSSSPTTARPRSRFPRATRPTEVAARDPQEGRRRRRRSRATRVLVQYHGVKWSRRHGLRLELGARRARAPSPTTGVVDGLPAGARGSDRRLAGARRRSRRRSATARARSDTSSQGETLVFVVDILGRSRRRRHAQ